MLLKDQNEFYKACFNSMQVGILVFNSTRDILLHNNFIEHILGYSKDEITLKKVTDLFKNTSFITNFIKNPENKKFNTALEVIGIQKNGLEIPIELVFGKIEFSTKIYYKILISDISIRKNKEVKILNLTHIMSLIKFNRRFPLFNQMLPNILDTDRLLDEDLFLNDNWIPAINVKENKNNFEIEVAALGFSKKDFEVTIVFELILLIMKKEKQHKLLTE